jgi:capsular exopolysaccharide synthesis family protein
MRLIIACTLLGVLVAGLFVSVATPKYTATAQLYVAGQNSTSITDLVQGSDFGQEQVHSYKQFIDSTQVTGPVATRLKNGLSAAQIAKEVSSTAPQNTSVLNVSVSDTSAARAAAVANAVSSQFTIFAEKLNSGKALNSPVKVTVVRFATVPGAQSSPRVLLDIVLGLLIGLVAGFGGALVRELLDRTVTTPDQLHDLVHLPVLGVIAYDADAAARPLIVSTDPWSARSEAFRQLRTNLRFINPDQRPRSITITSSVPGEAKTTTAVNLAIALAEAGLNVCLVEGDLRRPKASDYLGVERAAGLTDVLIGSVPLDDALQVWGTSKSFTFLASGPLPPNPSELLDSRGMEVVIAELERRFDLVLIDSPPLLPVTDGAVLASLTGGALFVVRHGITRREQVARAVGSLRSADALVFGAILTFVPTRGPDAYHYDYGYTYAPSELPAPRDSGSELPERLRPDRPLPARARLRRASRDATTSTASTHSD